MTISENRTLLQLLRATGVSKCIYSFRASRFALTLAALVLLCVPCIAQNAVVTQRYDNSRSGVNATETILTPSNVMPSQFGKLFSYSVDGYMYAQPLYLPNVTIPGKGIHNVIFVATEHDSVYAFDADSNAGANAQPLWKASFLSAGVTTVPSSDVNQPALTPEIGISSTPVIDPQTGTLYALAETKESGNYVQRLHALDVTTGAEKFGGPTIITATASGNGNGSVNGVVSYTTRWVNQRSALALAPMVINTVNRNVVLIGSASHEDQLPYHGWLLAYDASTLQQIAVFNSTPNGQQGGIWMSGGGSAIDASGNIFGATGNGTFDTNVNPPVDVGDTIFKLNLSTGTFSLADYFTPYNQANLDSADDDLGSGGVLLLPDQVGAHTHLLVVVSKRGDFYLVDRDNMGKFNTVNNSRIVQFLQGVVVQGFSTPVFWNNLLYVWGSGESQNDVLKAFSFTNGLLSTSPVKVGTLSVGFPNPGLTVSANGTTNGIVWSLDTSNNGSGPAILRANDASNIATTLYDSTTNSTRDNPGTAVKFTAPVVNNGKVYVGTATQISVFGLLNGAGQVAAPVFSLPGGRYEQALSVSISDSTPGATIYYTTDGNIPTTSSAPYAGPISVTSTTKIQAMAAASGLSNSGVVSATYTLQVATPTITPATGSYTSAQSVTISDTTPGATIYYSTDGNPPTTSSNIYSVPIAVNTTTTVQALAVVSGLANSAVASATYTLQVATPTFSPVAGTYSTAQSVTISDTTPGASIYYTTNGSVPSTSSTLYTAAIPLTQTTTIRAIAVAGSLSNSAIATGVFTIGGGANYSAGFTASGLQLNGSTISGTRLRITDGGSSESRSAYYATPVGVQAFTNDFTFQLTTPNGDGMTFVLQNSGLTALGTSGGGLGYGPDPDTPTSASIPKSIAVKFDLFGNASEGPNSTGLFKNGAIPTIPSVNLTGTGIDLHSGHIFAVHMTYDGTTLSMTITDTSTAAKFTTTFPIDIATTIGSTTAYAGFTGGTGGATATQEILTWTYSGTGPSAPTITSANNTTFTVGTAGSFSVTATGFPTPTLSESGALPNGVAFAAATGVLSGTPTVSGTFNLVFTAHNTSGPDATQNFTLTVNQTPAITSVNNTTFTVGTAGSFSVTATGFPTPTLSESGALPNGVTFTAATGVLSGTPTVSGTFNLVFTAHNASGPDAVQNFTLTVNPASNITNITIQNPSFEITNSLSSSCGTGCAYNAGAGIPGWTAGSNAGSWQVGSGYLTLPSNDGLVIAYSNSGTISQVLSSTLQANTTYTLSADIGHRSDGLVTDYTIQLLAGGQVLNSFAGNNGDIPAGTFASRSVTYTTPSSVNPNQALEIRFTNSALQLNIDNVTLTLNSGPVAPAITSANNTTFTVGTAGSFSVTATGFPTPTLSESGALPNGVTFAAATGVLSGTPTVNGTFNLVFTAHNASGPDAVQNFTLTVNPASNITNITIQNPSFEITNSLSSSCGTGCAYNAGVGIPGWTAGANAGSWQVGSGVLNLPASDGLVIAYSNGGTISQVLSSTLQANTTYTLSADIGHRSDGLVTDYTIQLLAGGQVLNSFAGNNGDIPAGTFASRSVTYTTPSSVNPNQALEIRFTNSALQLNIDNVTLTLNSGPVAPAITSANNTTFTVGTAGSFSVTATGFPTPTLSESGALPNGVTFAAATGVLSGTPTVNGTFNLVFTAHNASGPDAVQNFTLTVNPASNITNITIQNPSFEITNSLSSSCGTGCAYNAGAGIPGWTAGSNAGSWQVGSGYLTLPSNDGLVIAYSNSGTISQVLSSTLQANTTYTLSADIGHRSDGLVTDYTIQLLAGGQVLNSFAGNNGDIPAGTFARRSVTYTSPSSVNPNQALEIRFTNSALQLDIDNIALVSH